MPQMGVEERISGILKKICRPKGLLGALVCTNDGLTIASFTSRRAERILVEENEEGFDTIVGALGSLFLTVASRARQELHLKQVEELHLRDESGLKVVFRVFESAHHGRLILGLLMSSSVPYRRLTTNAIQMIQEAIDSD